MIAEVVAEVVLNAGRWFLMEVLVRGLLQTPGNAVLRAFKHRDREFHRDGLAIVVGVFFWVAVALAGMGIYAVINRGAI